MIEYSAEIVKRLKILRKLDFPPAGPNWVRFIFDDVRPTAKAILSFAKGQPAFGYQPGYRAIKDRLELGIGLDAAIKVAASKGAPAGRVQNKQLVEAFFDYDETRRYSSSNPIEFEKEFFRVSRDVLVPVAPLSIIREKGKFVPLFVCGWANNPLRLLQRRLLMTVYEDAFFSLTDYQASPGEVLFFPQSEARKQEEANENCREIELWRRGDYDLLSKAELSDCVEIFALAREQARSILQSEIDELRNRMKAENAVDEVGPSLEDLFHKK
ncbi:hypothetical protein C7U92_30640 [Bradyrhizobium sp. WBOS7]|uniref:Uncharacterized protein n=1 Tax=Bradyrhizobium betae TaxID=244734 RepID=A0AAE9N9X9_9BRAD|nr:MULTISPECIES: hypothetical protein [Bradyrhizobium]MDD1571230.1 hypothetical protein [Bradyrhizobium sp. WBOS1]UUO34483.1 hypothetical protein DCK84_07770 [Bradyrhizobium sp. WBOS01]MDD1531550.1 hypothetical protein [Bradyrhizobium sp. WBOS2]MDD1581045.1 hypothetical protein [Bradyrhizobium sp. WBOS7]MDD1601787.1 hypothetical protein [Bradyrhizobium sp. WBOS16]